ncbi:MAG: hypothetical protein A3G32_04240 [Deltaproteobacteria bacterium RIFCSPLOWO2_12_FULL_40_28]|nr:MAG: hypothetical protein A3C45_08350 [Deltaproteobacteria bacterium RIFCSPHIGHO2_02_FULL_40_28]OGQ19580.1 MAG: hypothetical protein A3E27_07545 [Deltaproteobacteria bacterium RIFCSPHIGHO2_12_FULL_40_32]OGQ40857.1 MAG: hypothetical protein A3I69_02960 [Deltaproteobacteria bacterium RIFCSPLOWO2_02_FULL_40_36]OGQ53972.1 MAG: hypothetical protein A3G32_04240 [Deltaproteobacteria bacterium RIFCSPLOWO2_12_FULL_40_28]
MTQKSHSHQPLKVYLCDLTHDTVILVSDTIPINIGFIGAYANKIHGKNIELSFFKYPNTVIQAIKDNPPDVIALSNYSWNSNLSEMMVGLAKKYNPNVVTIQGGTNFPHDNESQLSFLMKRPNTDVYVELEAEVAFSELLTKILDARDGGASLFDGTEMPGCVYLVPSARHSANPVFVKGQMPVRVRELDDIPSPYLNGMLDSFFDGKLTPFLETNRGCPFSCTFCHTGNEYFNKINMFSMERVKEEILYIAPKMAERGIVNLHLADTNFAMYPRDKEICEVLLETQKKYGWPRQVMATTGKNSKERVIEITSIMGNTFSVNMSVQSMDPSVLKNINRSNIKLNHYMEINKQLNATGRATKGEVIIGLPGETRQSFVHGLQQILEAGTSTICCYSLMLLHGTRFKEPAYREEFQIKGKYRIVPLNYGEYDGDRIFDIEETGIANKDMSFDDYLWIRRLSLMIEVLHNSRPFHELFKYVSSYEYSLFDFIMRVNDSFDSAPEKVKEVVNGFLNETKGELWNSEEELVAHYRRDENYNRLLKGEVGGNIIYKYKAMSLAFYNEAWVDFIAQICQKILSEKIQNPEAQQKAFEDINLLAVYVKNKLKGLLNVHGEVAPSSMTSPYDIQTWSKSQDGLALNAFKFLEPIQYEFEYSEGQLAERTDLFKRYGTHANALSKIVTRVSNVESLFRKINIHGAHQKEGPENKVDQFIRYTLSN